MAEEAPKETITVQKSSVKLFAIVLVAALLGSYGGSVLSNGFSPSGNIVRETPTNNPTPSPTQPSPSVPTGGSVKLSDVWDSSDPVKGDPNAPVSIVEFSDFQCPFCGRFYTQTLGQIDTEYIKTGKVKFQFRDYPLSFHPMAEPGSLAAECANEQGKFWEYHDKIFENQAALSTENLKQWATDVGLDVQKFNDCFDSGKYKQEVQSDFSAGSAAGTSGTPTFYICGNDGSCTQVVGAQQYAAFKSAIDPKINA